MVLVIKPSWVPTCQSGERMKLCHHLPTQVSPISLTFFFGGLYFDWKTPPKKDTNISMGNHQKYPFSMGNSSIILNSIACYVSFTGNREVLHMMCGKKREPQKEYVNIPSEKYIYVHIHVCICVYTYLCKMDERRSYASLSKKWMSTGILLACQKKWMCRSFASLS